MPENRRLYDLGITSPEEYAERCVESDDSMEAVLNWHIGNRKPMISVYARKEFSYKLLASTDTSDHHIMIMKKFCYVLTDLLERAPPAEWGFGKFTATSVEPLSETNKRRKK